MTRRFDVLTAPLDQGTVLLEASAGTGKTYAVVGLLLRLLLERQIDRLDQALVVTFTVAATEELKNRLRAGLVRTLAATRNGDPDPVFEALASKPDAAKLLAAALDDFDQVAVTTIHGFCKRLLDEAAFESRESFALEFVADPLPYLHSAAADALRSCYTPEISVPGALLGDARLEPRELVRLYSLWQRYPKVVLAPVDPDPDSRYPAVLAAVERAAAALDDDAAGRIARFDWLSGKAPFLVASRYSTARLRGRIAQHLLLALPEFRVFARGQLEKNLKVASRKTLDHPFFDACAEVETAATEAAEHLRSALLHRMHARLDADKRREHVMDFQDLLARTHAALHDPERRDAVLAALSSRYRTALIDEFQDTDRLQYDIFATCFRGRSLFLIGDPKQSIYGFRGADLRAYGDARKDATDAFTLATNYRSSKALVLAVQQTCNGPGAFIDGAIEVPKVEAKATAEQLLVDGEDLPPLHWRVVTNDGVLHKSAAEERIALDVTAEITRLLGADLRCGNRPLQPRDIAVLCRTNKQSTLIQGHLRHAGVVSAIGKAGDVFATDELVELHRLMTAVLQPRNLQACRAAMSTRIYGFTAARLAALEHEEEAFDAEIARFDRWRRTWVRHGFFAMKEQLLEDLEVESRILPLRGGERRLTNFQQLCELLHRAEHDNRLSPEGLHEWLQHERLHHDEIDYELRELRLESDEDAVQILTVHGAKGLQYEVVFCPYLWDGRETRGAAVVPDGDERHLVFKLLKDHPRKNATELERLAEDVRLCYVALTRARRRCYVHIGALPNAHKSALAWLLAPVEPDQRRDPPGKPEGRWFVNWTERLRKNPDQIRDGVARLVEQNGELMMQTLVAADPIPQAVRPPEATALTPPRRARREPRARGLYSFSSLIGDAGPEPLARDTADMADTPAAPEPSQPPSGIFAFARGPVAGNCLHTILEHLDWGDLDNAELPERIATSLMDFGLADRDAHDADIDPTAVVHQNLRDLAAARVRAGGPTFAELCSGTSAPEWQFTLPTRDSAIEGLAAALRASESAVARRYAERLADLPPRVLHGFLTGFVDHVGEHEGRFWIIDWKSNYLGDRLEAYGPQAIGDAMHGHDYVLQYHLYVLALHRLLRTRLPDYDYDRHFGGVSYAFLRGAIPGSDNGMFFDRPPRALTEAMDDWARGRPTGARA